MIESGSVLLLSYGSALSAFQVLSCYENLHAYLMVADAYLDIILENQLVIQSFV